VSSLACHPKLAQRHSSEKDGLPAVARCERVRPTFARQNSPRATVGNLRVSHANAGLPSEARAASVPRAKDGTGTGIRTPVPWLRNAAGDLDGLRLRRFCRGFCTDLWVVSGPNGRFRAQSFKNLSSASRIYRGGRPCDPTGAPRRGTCRQASRSTIVWPRGSPCSRPRPASRSMPSSNACSRGWSMRTSRFMTVSRVPLAA